MNDGQRQYCAFYCPLCGPPAVCLCGQASGLLDQSCVQKFPLMTSLAWPIGNAITGSSQRQITLFYQSQGSS